MSGADIVVLRYGHRPVRDYRITTHCCLVARAFGAKKIIIHGPRDESISESVADVNKRWGNGFSLEFGGDWKSVVQGYKKQGYFVVHLTMYGRPLQEEIGKLRKKKKMLVVVGSQKVSSEMYNESDANISVAGQPHSEVAALAVALDWLQRGKELGKRFRGGQIRVVPQSRGKKVLKSG